MAAVASCPTLDDLQRLLGGQLGPADAQRLRHHVAGCARCRDTLHQLQVKDTLPEADQAHPDRQPPIASPAAETTTDGKSETAQRTRPEQCSFLAPPEGPDELGRLGGYRVLRILGAGGMGIVLEAEDPRLKRHVALKVMKPALAASDLARRRFLREAQAIAALEHDHIVAIHKVGEDRGVPFLAMPLLRGESLEERLQRSACGLAETLRIGREVAAGLEAAHAAGLTHRDIKPANVWLEDRGQRSEDRGQKSEVRGQRSDGAAQHLELDAGLLTSDLRPLTSDFRVKILDFGLARPEKDDAHLTQAGTVAGTPSYMAPEQAEGRAVDARSDLFSLGAMLYRMATGRLPFQGVNALAVLRALAVKDPPPPRKLNAEVPAEFSDLIIRLLAKQPADRPQSAQQVVDALTRIERDLAAKPAVKRSSKRRIAVLAILTGSVLVAAAVGFAISLRTHPVPPSAVLPFVILTADGHEHMKFATLQAALDEAVDDDVIEVRGDGPFSIPLVNARGKALTIRAGDGYWPVFQPEKTDYPVMLYANGALTLEGLEFRDVYGTPHGQSMNWSLRAWKSSLRMANCRFVFSQPPETNGFLSDVPWLEFRNCIFLCGGASHAGAWTPKDGGRLIMENNILAGDKGDRSREWHLGPNFHFREPGLRRASIQLIHNTFVGRHLNIFLERKPQPGEISEPGIRVEAAYNVWDTAKGVFNVHQPRPKAQPLPAAEAEGLIRSLVTWHDRRNVLPETVDFLRTHGVDVFFEPVKSLAEWAQFWGQKSSGDVQGPLHYQKDGLHALLEAQDQSLMAEDFRLAPSSAGKGTGEGGRDLGADVDLVGPGPAYERWKKTPDYQAWRAWPSENPPFVVMSPRPAASTEARFVTLAAAVAAAKPDDVIEIRGRGPFITAPIDLANKPLTIRAGAGCRPVVQLSPEGVASHSPLLRTSARLTLEALDLRRHDPGDTTAEARYRLVMSWNAPLFVTHCRFLMGGRGGVATILAQKCPVVEVRYCQFGGDPATRGVKWEGVDQGRLVVENCLFPAMGDAVVYMYTIASVRQLSLRFVNNSVVGGVALRGNGLGTRDDVLAVNARGRKPIQEMPIQVEMTDNLIDAACCAAGNLSLAEGEVVTPQQYKMFLHCLIGMREERNLFRAGLRFLDMRLNQTQPVALADSFAQWQAWQVRPESGSREVPLRYETGDPEHRARARPERTHPSDFRANPDTPGLKVDSRGVNIGIKHGQVGPGAYHRWRATPEYQEWLKTTGQRP
jgi:serine/threonine protein kinase